jgi:hypothetical protein
MDAKHPGWDQPAQQEAAGAVIWDAKWAMSVMRRVGDNSFGETDVLETLDFLRVSEIVRAEMLASLPSPAPQAAVPSEREADDNPPADTGAVRVDVLPALKGRDSYS